jgi:hypothetical protein
MFWFLKPVTSIAMLFGLISMGTVSLIERAYDAHRVDAFHRLKTLQIVSQRVMTRVDGQVVGLGVDVMDYDFVGRRVRLKRLRQNRIEQIVHWDGSQVRSWQLGDVERGFAAQLTRAAFLTGPLFMLDLETRRDCTSVVLSTCTIDLPTQRARLQFTLTESGLLEEQIIQMDGEELNIRFGWYRKVAGIQMAHHLLFASGGVTYESRVISIAINNPWTEEGLRNDSSGGRSIISWTGAVHAGIRFSNRMLN